MNHLEELKKEIRNYTFHFIAKNTLYVLDEIIIALNEKLETSVKLHPCVDDNFKYVYEISTHDFTEPDFICWWKIGKTLDEQSEKTQIELYKRICK